MSVLDEVLKEEYDRLARMKSAMSIEYNALPKGSISKENIRGCDCYYLQFRALHMKPELFEDYYRDTCLIQKQDMIAFMKANTAYALKESFGNATAEVHVYYGDKETKEIKRSAEVIRKSLPACELHSLPSCYHGEFSINRPEEYAAAVKRIAQRRP